MIRIEVTEEVKSITSRKSGSKFTLQIGYAHTAGAKYPERFEFFAPKTGEVKPGTYQLAADAIYVNEGRLAVDAGRLVPVVADAARKAA